ncbi:MAG TPA: hypothetical protein PKA12_07310 [Saprospiraceae bacterium]|nr:hypothetical protein [Saprospiraceae bacterium]
MDLTRMPYWVKMYVNSRLIARNIIEMGFGVLLLYLVGLFFLYKEPSTFKINDISFFILFGLFPFALMQWIVYSYVKIKGLSEVVNDIPKKEILVYNLIGILLHISLCILLGNILPK